MTKKVKRVAILGTTPTRMQAPINDKNWKIWTIGPGGMKEHHWDRLYEVHQTWPEDFGEYLSDLSLIKKPQLVYSITPMGRAMESWAERHGKDRKWLEEQIKGDWSSNVVIDRDRVFEKYGRQWFSSSISYALALAIDEGFTEIGLWGIDLESGEEYISQHTGCKHLIDLGKVLGIQFHFPDGCGLLRDLNPYPDRYETFFALTLEKKRNWLNHILAQNEPQYEAHRQEVYRLEGRLLTMRGAGAPAEEIQKAEGELIGQTRKMWELRDNLNQLRGEKAATEYYQRMFVWGVNDP